MAAVAENIVIVTLPTIRRFELADLSQHSKWFMPRFMAAYPHLNERGAASFLRSVLYQPDFMFLYQEHAIGLAQVMSAHTLSAQPILWERFVWVENKDDLTQIRDAAFFYVEWERWAQNQGVDVMVIEEQSDVPHEVIKQKLGHRVFTRQQQFVKVPPKTARD